MVFLKGGIVLLPLYYLVLIMILNTLKYNKINLESTRLFPTYPFFYLEFNIFDLTLLTTYSITYCMYDIKFFIHPIHEWQKRYEALRASIVDRLPAKIVADRFGYSPSYIRLLKHNFKHGKIDFSEPVPEGKTKRRRVNTQTRQKICDWRRGNLSAGEIAQLLFEDGIDISVRTVERVLAEEGFPKLPRRTRLKIGLTIKGTQVPARSEVISLIEGQRFSSPAAGIFIFAPFLAKLKIAELVRAASLPGSKVIPAKNYILSFLALKLLGTERYAHVGDHSFDPGLGLFAGLNTIPKCTAMSTYSYSLDEVHLLRLQRAFVKQASKIGLYDNSIINLDFHTAPHFGDESVLQEHRIATRGKSMKSALVLFAQDAGSKLILYTASDIKRDESDEQVLYFLSFWKKIHRGISPTLVFDSKFTTYEKLSELNEQGVKFITLRRRGSKLISKINNLTPWKRINVPHAKRKYPNPLVHDSLISLNGYKGVIRQIIVRDNGHEKPAFIITNDFDAPTDLLVSNYARRWRVENGISEAVKFFHLNALSSPILVKVHFDITMTMIADTLYCMLAKKLRGFEECDAPKIFRHFVRGGGNCMVKNGEINVTYPRRAHNPILRAVDWNRLPDCLPGIENSKLNLIFK